MKRNVTAKKIGTTRGFSLVEMVVAFAIFIVITSIVLVNQGRFGGSVLITNLAYDVALSVRQAQVYGISVRRTQGVTDASGLEQFNRSYGIHFEKVGYFILFADLDKNGRYDATADNGVSCLSGASNPECVSVFKVEQGNSVSKFCGGSYCTNSPAGSKITTLDVLFHRPDPEPIINAFGDGAIPNPLSTASVTVSSPQGATKEVCISASGQIYIKQVCP